LNSILGQCDFGMQLLSSSQSEFMSVGGRYANKFTLRGLITAWPFGLQVCFPVWFMRRVGCMRPYNWCAQPFVVCNVGGFYHCCLYQDSFLHVSCPQIWLLSIPVTFWRYASFLFSQFPGFDIVPSGSRIIYQSQLSSSSTCMRSHSTDWGILDLAVPSFKNSPMNFAMCFPFSTRN